MSALDRGIDIDEEEPTGPQLPKEEPDDYMKNIIKEEEELGKLEEEEADEPVEEEPKDYI